MVLLQLLQSKWGGAFVGSDWENMAVEVVVDKPGIGPRG